ncbi:hypothetical protein ILYODFUR_016364 [Ilyodon furcidens]|uniref:Uncharacterized protein n=1 Tax=Ilyodon furcidens TaxID=33524 RepID=A0ABV0VG04_9TELE
MEMDKIDPSVIKLMTDEKLKEYLPSYGDRVAVFGYCRRREPEPSGRKSKLFERLRGKLTYQNQKDIVENKEHPNSNAKKSERKIELGWLHFRDKHNSLVQMRTKKGTGT